MDHRKSLLSQCAAFVGMTEFEVSSIAKTAPQRYFVWTVEKRSGGRRVICHPAKELKPLQDFFSHEILMSIPVHPCATAYKKGSSIKINARMHVGSRVIAKFDFKDFFPSIKVRSWERFAKKNFLDWTDSDIEFSKNVLFWGAGKREPKQLAIGSKTSPAISNILCFDIDENLAHFAASHGMIYTRYADDLTFSTKGNLDVESIKLQIEQAAKHAKFIKPILNEKKIVLASNRTRRTVTGLNLTPDGKVSIGRDRKRLIRSMVEKRVHGKDFDGSSDRLKGLLAFSQDIEPDFVATLRRVFGSDNIDKILRE
ncbi:retron St85 family RNA-directed DNA polymerase [Franzmannia qiaohouensis]|uniref:RNA-directed DNA polymerase n=1 Tax=Franzmannia qiaohouensis TaxID=1329370 RepID=A0ABU1HK46_9GAMM|nr:retron St85 family RNA-directed DNA polymerase [Halomonas qiaohouensis]MDR5907870.1 retron St85 family RNA-directed DNA polymerase [Halomonas qiaohouensis]